MRGKRKGERGGGGAGGGVLKYCQQGAPWPPAETKAMSPALGEKGCSFERVNLLGRLQYQKDGPSQPPPPRKSKHGQPKRADNV